MAREEILDGRTPLLGCGCSLECPFCGRLLAGDDGGQVCLIQRHPRVNPVGLKADALQKTLVLIDRYYSSDELLAVGRFKLLGEGDTFLYLHPLQHERIPVNVMVKLIELLMQISVGEDRKSTRLNSSHQKISYAVFC